MCVLISHLHHQRQPGANQAETSDCGIMLQSLLSSQSAIIHAAREDYGAHDHQDSSLQNRKPNSNIIMHTKTEKERNKINNIAFKC